MKGNAMKIKLYVRLKSEVLDVQGDAVLKALTRLGFEGIKNVRVGKLVELEVDDKLDRADVKAHVEKMADALLANPVIEDYEVIL